MRLNFLFFIIFFLVLSFFITINLYFERSYQNDALNLTHRKLGLLTQYMAENISLLLNFVPAKIKALPKKDINSDHFYFADPNFLESYLVNDLSLLFNVRMSISVEKINKKLSEFSKINFLVSPNNSKIIYYFILPFNNYSLSITSTLSLNDLFNKYFKQIKIGENGYAWLIAKDGTLLYHPTQPTMVGNNIFKENSQCFVCHKNFDIEKQILTSNIGSGYQFFYSPDKLDKILYYSKILVLHQQLILFISVPYNEILAYLDKSMKLHSLIIISLFLTMIILGTLFYYMNAKRIAAEEKLRSYSLLESIIESTQSKIVVIDNSYRILLVNSSYAKMLKMPKELIISKIFFEVCPQQELEYKDLLHKKIDEALNGSTSSLFNYPLYEDGELKLFHVVVVPLIIQDKISGVVITCDDITEEVKLRQELERYAKDLEFLVEERTRELKEEKEKLSMIMQTIDSGLAIIDHEGTITWMNSKMAQLLNKKEGSNICDLFGTIGECLNPERPVTFVQEVVTNGQRRFFQTQITPFKMSEGDIKFICLIQDITELKMMEEKLIQSEKLESLSRISAGLAHEIGNPLASISSYVQVLKDLDLDDFVKQSLNIISKHINRISEIIRNISNFAKLTKTDLTLTDLNEVLKSSLELVKFDKRMQNIKLEVDYKPLPKVLVDPNQLSQVFINLILNAADAMPMGGELRIESELENGYLLLHFRDTGVGISPEDLPKIFDPFFTTKERGTGLGLFVSYTIIKNFGGDISVKSELGKGSTFTLKLPIPKRES